MAAKIKKGLILPDIHIPFENTKALSAVVDYAAANAPWDYFVILGDFMDLDFLSSFVKDSPGDVENRRLVEDYDRGNAWLDEFDSIFGKSTKKVFLMGNHEARTERFVKRHPWSEGIFNVAKMLQLRERKYKVVKSYPNSETYKIGKLHFHHGQYTTDAHAKKHATMFGANIAYGHTHDVQSYTAPAFGKGTVHEAYSLGCLCDLEQGYVGKKPTNWSHAFGVGYWRRGGNYNLRVTRIFDGKFVGEDGELYGNS